VARHVRDARIEGRDARRRLPLQSEPHWRAIVQGVHVGYYKGRRSTAWVVGWASLRAAIARSLSASRMTWRRIGAAAFRLCETGRVRRPAGAAGGRRDLRLRRRQTGADPGGPSRAGPMRRARPLGRRSPLSAPWRRQRAPRACPSSTPCRACAPMAGTFRLALEERPRLRYPNLAVAGKGMGRIAAAILKIRRGQKRAVLEIAIDRKGQMTRPETLLTVVGNGPSGRGSRRRDRTQRRGGKRRSHQFVVDLNVRAHVHPTVQPAHTHCELWSFDFASHSG
jgi:hypothetical protein